MRKRYISDNELNQIIKLKQAGASWLMIQNQTGVPRRSAHNAYEDWQNLIFLRNCIVHNNGFSDENRSINIGGITIDASVGKMIQGKLDDFAILTEVAVDRCFAWVKALIKKYGN